MINIEELKQKLSKENILEVSRQTGIHVNILYRFVKKTNRPAFKTVAALHNYFTDKKI